jgi:hypothetical protein
MMRRASILITGMFLAGCAGKTETGYEPRKLGDSLTVQRGYYAAPFSPEMRDAASEAEGRFDARRPDLRN